MKLCPEKFPNAYKDGDMCCKFKDELKDGGNSSEFAWKYLCEKTKDNLYLHLDKLWKLDDATAKAKLKSLGGNWKANDFDGGNKKDEWIFSPGVSHFYKISDLYVCFRQMDWHLTFVFLGDP